MLTLLKFYADWCGPCKAMIPTMDKIKEEFSDDVIISNINIDDNPQVRAQYGIRSIPSFVLLKDGQEIDRKVGSQTYGQLEEWLESKFE